MSTNDSIQKVSLDQNDTISFTCPKCNKTKKTQIKKYKNIDRAVKLKFKCPCGNMHNVLLERRRYYRKATNLPGTCITSQNESSALCVVDISRSGLKLKFESLPHLNIGDDITVKFTLDDKKKTKIEKNVKVTKIDGVNVGVKILRMDPYDPLGFYLLS